jgi:DNA (cytosine-5)-methyltransferase 1
VVHYEEDIRTLELSGLAAVAQHAQAMYPDAKLILWASLECTNFSKAKGGQPRDADSRTLADHLDRYIQALDPDYVQIENVVEFMSWGPLDDKGKPVSRKNGSDWLKWCTRLCSYGYYDEWRELNSANYGAYTSRNRLFGCFARHGLPIAWPVPTHGRKVQGTMFEGLKKWKAVKDVLDFSDEGKSIFEREKPLSEKTLERIYAGLLKYVAGGETNYLAKIYAVASNSHGTYSTESAAHTITTRDAHALIQPAFISKYYSGRPDGKNIPVDGPAGTITTIDSQALVQTKFMVQRNNGDPKSRVTSADDPARTLTATGGNLHVVQPSFLTNYYGSGGQLSSINDPSGTITTKARQALVNPQYLINYHHSSDVNGVNDPCPTLTTRDKLAIATPVPFISRNFTGGGQHSSVDSPAGALLSVPKLNLVQAFIMPTNYDNKPHSVDEPHKAITADRHWSYLVNPAWGGHTTDVSQPCPVIVARQDKAPLYIVCAEGGTVGIRIDENDSECMRKIKEFMVVYNIIDIKMRMLKVSELLKIQGFPDDYKLAGNQSDQKKFIGNSVVPHVVKAWCLAMVERLTDTLKVA